MPGIGGEASTVEDAIKRLTYNVAVKAIIDIALSRFPWLGFPIISNVFQFIVGQVADKLYFELSNVIVFQVIQFTNDAHNAAYQASLVEVKNTQISGDAEAHAKAIAKYQETLRNLIRFNRP